MILMMIFFKYVDKDFCKSCFWPRDYFIYFGGNKYTIVFDGELTDEVDDVLDIMLSYSKDSHTFDFIQDNIKIDVDIFEKELVIEIEEKE